MGESRRRREFDLSAASKHLILPEDIPLLMRKAAEELAGAWFDGQMIASQYAKDDTVRHRSQRFRAHWGRDSRLYVRLNWPSFIPDAKDALVRAIHTDKNGYRPASQIEADAIEATLLEMASDENLLDFSEALNAVMPAGST